MPKIDVIFGNPPYTNGVHLKHLQRAYEITQRIVLFLHPMAWLHAQKPGSKSLNERATEIKKVIGNHFVWFKLFNGNKIFPQIKYGQVCGLTLVDKKKIDTTVVVEDRTLAKNATFSSALLINPMYLDPEVFEPLKEKLWAYCSGNNLESLVNQKRGDFFVNLPLISGHVDETGKSDTFLKADFYQLIYDSDKVVTSKPKPNKQTRWLSFSSKEEAKNCIAYLASSKVAKFCLMIVKTQQNLHRGELLYVPSFDFTKLRNDVDLYQELDLSDEEIAVIERVAA